VKPVALEQMTTTAQADIVGNGDLPVVETQHPDPRGQRHQDLAHDHSLNDRLATATFRPRFGADERAQATNGHRSPA
jgi:hypothetical protein